MINCLGRLRKKRITKDEIFADLIFFLVPAFVSFCIIFIFDIHHSLYEFPIFPLKFVFHTNIAYLIGIPGGALVGFFLIKLLIFGFHESQRG